MLLARKGFARPVHGHHLPRVQPRHSQRGFGRGQVRTIAAPAVAASAPHLSGDFKLFAVTLVGGFLFVSVLLA